MPLLRNILIFLRQHSLILILLWFSKPAVAQHDTVVLTARLSADTVLLGQPFTLTVSAGYPATTELFYPDTGSNYAPFELLNREFYPTSTLNGISADCVVYHLAAFELGKHQTLQLPVYLVATHADSTLYQTPTVGLIVAEVIQQPVDTLSVKATDNFLPIKQKLNYPYIIIIGLCGLGILLIGFVSLRRPIAKWFKLRRLNRLHQQFLADFETIIAQLQATNQPATFAQKLLVVWKKHLTKLTAQPFDTFTSKQVVAALPNQQVEQVLHTIDACIYGGRPAPNLPSEANVLKQIAIEKFDTAQQIIKNHNKVTQS